MISGTLPIEIKEEPLRDKYDYQKLSLASSEIVQKNDKTIAEASNVTASMTTTILASPVTPVFPIVNNLKTASKSMIQSRKDYSYKYAVQQQSKVPSSSNTQHETQTSSFHLDISQKQQPNVEMHTKKAVKTLMSSINKNPSIKGHPYNRPMGKEPLCSSLKPNISILERYNYNKSNLKVIKREKPGNVDETKPCAIEEVVKISSLQPKVMVENLDTANILKVPIGAMLKFKKATESESPSKKKKKLKKKKKEKREREAGEDDEVVQDQVKVVVSQKVETPTKMKQESSEMSSGSTRLMQQTMSTESKDSQNINKINNKINIIFQLNDRKNNIILHRRVPKKMTKITIKEANNNLNNSSGNKAQGSDSDAYEATAVPEKSKILCTIQTQTDDELIRKSTAFNMNVNSLLPYDDITEHLFFENDILICLQRNTISFFQYHRLSALLKKGETDFRLIDRIERRVNDVPVDNDNKFQRLCYNDGNSLPIYVEMRAKQKELEDPLNCPIAFVYCNVYYIDQRSGKFSSVHLDTVKSVISDICYATLPKSSYFLMAWSEQSPDTRSFVTGIVKYKLTPNLDLAKLAR